ncbi:MAG: sulfatase-like hydrolase/transferase [Bacteroidales bacterium]|jgi:arylsulfatase A-like enzyme|nr:sulfatase-like hydrolase/transferase [Bacteroidales bacterium]
MKKTIRLLFFFCLALSISACKNTGKSSADTKKPNVLILFSDQHNKNVMGYENHPDVITPNLDKLASEGLVFDRAYCPVGICTPSRSSFLTGLMPRTLGLLTNPGHTSVMEDAVSMATIFKTNGYKTYTFGKRHVSSSIDAGWDVKKDHMFKPDDDDNYISWIERNGYAMEFAEDWAAEFGRGPRGSSAFDSIFPTADLGTRISKLPEGYTMEAYTMKETIKMIQEEAESDSPFFCWANFYRPHQPYNPLEKYMKMYDVSDWGEGTKKGGSIKMPDNFYEPAEHLPPLLQSQRKGGNKVWNMDKAFENEQLWRNYIGAYYALVTEIDHCVGEILFALEEAGIEDETIVIYTSDHGDFAGNHGMVEKAAAGQNIYEDILNIPLIIKYPGKIKGGEVVAELVLNSDILPTLIELLDLDTPELIYPIQGESLADLILNNDFQGRDYIVSESWSQATVITRQYKLGMMIDPTSVHPAWDYREFGDMFFDRINDPLETDNRIDDQKYIEQIKLLRGYLEEYEQNTSAKGKEELIMKANNN